MHLVTAARVLVLSALLAHGLGRDLAASTPSPPDGSTLVRELGCAVCHGGLGTTELIRNRAPVFGPQAPLLPAAFVFSYLEDPQRRRPDIGASRMPDFALDEGERLALAMLLGTPDGDAALTEARSRYPDVDAETGRRVFGALGCAGCHAGVEGTSNVQAPDLSRQGVRARPAWLSGYLTTPTPVRGEGHPDLRGARMPDFRLTPDEVEAISTYLQGLGRSFASLEEAPLTTFETRRTERLVENRLACMGCHKIGERGGAIGPSLDGVSLRRQPSFILEMLLDPRRAAPGAPMPHQPLPPREASRVARYLLAFPETGPDRTHTSLVDADHLAWTIPATPTSPGGPLYQRHCAACHGVEGRGDGWNAPNLPVPPAPLADPALMGRRTDDTLYDGISAGAWVLDGSPRMPAFGGLLSPSEIRSLVTYIRSLCECQGPAWSADGSRRGSGGR